MITFKKSSVVACCCKLNNAHIQVVINCQYSVAQMCTREDTLAHNLGAQYFDDVMSCNSLTTQF